MSHSKPRIPEDMLADILAEAARIYSDTDKGYSVEELKQICLEAQIPPHIVEQAIKEVEARRLRKQEKRQKFQKQVKEIAQKSVSVGTSLLMPAIALYSLVIVLNPLISDFTSPPNPPLRSPKGTDRVSKQPKNAIALKRQAKSAPTAAEIPKYESIAEPEEPKVNPEQPPEQVKRVSREPDRDLDSDLKETPKPQSPPAPNVLFQEEFHTKASNQTKQVVTQAVGAPARTSDKGDLSFWYYDNVTDPASGEVGPAIVTFNDGLADGISFTDGTHALDR